MMPRRLFGILFVLLVSLRAAQAENVEERWYVVRFQGRHAGWLHEQVRETADQITSEHRMHLSVRRGAFTISMEMASRFIETADGRPVSATTTQKMAMEEVEKTIRFSPDGLEVITRQGGREHREQLPSIQTPWLTPGAASRYVQEQLDSGQKLIRFHTIDPGTSLEPYEMTIEVQGPAIVEVFGRQAPALKCSVAMSLLPGAKMIEYTDEEGRTLRSTLDFGGIQMEVLAADKELAMAKLDPPELVASTLVRPSFTLLRPRQMQTATYRLSVADGRMPDLAESPVQKVRRIDERTVEVAIDLSTPPAEREADPVGVRNNTMIAGNDPRIAELAARASRNVNGNKSARAEAMRRFVGSYIHTTDLSVGMASASEVARTRTGDCTEHAVLLAAMLQADGIPARTASGLIYIDQFVGERHIFGYHMWTQVWLDDQWVDLDATIDDAFDAAHILLSTSHLDGNESVNAMVTMAPLMGQLRIDLAE